MIELRAIVFLNGDYTEQQVGSLMENDIVVAVDGGAKYLLKRRITPRIFVGDADSVEKSVLEELLKLGCEVYLYPEDKDEIDAQLAIERVLQLGVDEIIIRGWQGERLDMILALIYLMHKYHDVKMIAKDDNLEMGVITGHVELDSVEGEKWSILPICGDAAGVTLEGFKYPLHKGSMPCHKPFGVSNVAITSKVRITVEKGSVVYFRWIRQPS
ncbi:thiamine diphosphokinase [Pseudothermotoga sp. U03pept]|uniref:thiamine diphosphokinase n=1 Tax=Pseudothermotoga sp. U03pept TaxID=3447012 RepID=UPI0030B76058